MNILDTLRISASGMSAQRVRLQAISSNIANARSTSTQEGEPYRRKCLYLKLLHMILLELRSIEIWLVLKLLISRKSQADFRQVFDPAHPDADEEGYVRYPNVDILYEMVDMMTTSRSYEANTSAVETTYQLANLGFGDY